MHKWEHERGVKNGVVSFRSISTQKCEADRVNGQLVRD